jgi:hypothetical protein
MAKARSVFGSSICPTSHTTLTPNGRGTFTLFDQQAFSVYWLTTVPNSQPSIIQGLIRGKWASLGWETSILGFPVSDELTMPDGVGKRSNFESGSIIWTPQTPASLIRGAIRAKWDSLVPIGLIPFLGYPVTDELPAPDGIGRFNHFQNSSIYWKPSVSAHVLYGPVRDLWANQGWERGPLGYPITDEVPTSAESPNRFCDFENGVVEFTAATATSPARTTQLAPIITKSPADVLAQVEQTLDSKLPHGVSRVRPGIFVGPPFDYFRDSTGMQHNRIIQTKSFLWADASPLPNPYFEVTLRIEIRENAFGTAVVGVLKDWGAQVWVPPDTAWLISANDILNDLHDALDPLEERDNKILDTPINPLSVKVMPDNSVQAFIG